MKGRLVAGALLCVLWSRPAMAQAEALGSVVAEIGKRVFGNAASSSQHPFSGIRKAIDSKSLQFLTLGVTSRINVLLALGEPDAASPDGRLFFYRWAGISGRLILGSTSISPNEPVKTSHLFIAFDDLGVVRFYGPMDALLKAETRPKVLLSDSRPLVVPIQYWQASASVGFKDADLILGKESIDIGLTDARFTVFSFPVENILCVAPSLSNKIDYPFFAYYLRLSAGSESSRDVYFMVPFSELPALLGYLIDANMECGRKE
jgi:hypothetical protein